MTLSLFSGQLVNRNRFTLLVLAFLFWTMMAALFTTKSNLYYSLRGISTSWIHLSIHYVASAWTWLIISPLIYWFYKRVSWKGHSFIRSGLTILPTLLIVAVAHRLGSLSLDIAFRKYMGYIDGHIWQELMEMDSMVVSGVFDSAIVFLLILAFFYGRDLFNARRGHSTFEMENIGKEERLMVKHNGQFMFIVPEDLISVVAAGNYVKLEMNGGELLMVRETLTAFYTRLKYEEFIRVNRSNIVNKIYIKSLQPRYNGEYTIQLQDGRDVHASRKYSSEWRPLLHRS